MFIGTDLIKTICKQYRFSPIPVPLPTFIDSNFGQNQRLTTPKFIDTVVDEDESHARRKLMGIVFPRVIKPGQALCGKRCPTENEKRNRVPDGTIEK